MRWFLCGIKHCGKSTLGSHLATRLHCPFIDSDQFVEKIFRDTQGEKLSCREIFRQYGEDFFRRLEAEALQTLCANSTRGVIALGGGTLSNRYIALELLKKSGKIIYLEIAQDLAFERIQQEGLPPFLQNCPDPRREFERQNRDRIQRFEEAADVIFPLSDPPLSVAEQVQQLYLKIKQE